MTLAEFRVAFPSFVNQDDDVVQTYLDDAAGMLHQATWGALYDRAHGLQTAILLSDEPMLNSARMNKTSAHTTYSKQFKRLLLKIGTSPVST